MDFNYFFYFTDEETGHRGEIAQGHSILSEFEDKPRSAGCKAIIFPLQQAVFKLFPRFHGESKAIRGELKRWTGYDSSPFDRYL